MPSKTPQAPTGQKTEHQVARTSTRLPLSQAQSIDPVWLQCAMADPAHSMSAGVLALQRAAGNRVTTHLIQTKSLVERRGDGGLGAGPELEGRLAAHRGGGSPLLDDVRAYMEPRFGADFSGVRVHTGGEAAYLNRQISAQAFTHGQDIYMGSARFEPGADAGKRLLAHELTHVVQQTGHVRRNKMPMSAAGPAIQRRIDPVSENFTDAKSPRGGAMNAGVYIIERDAPADSAVVKYTQTPTMGPRAAFADEALEAAGLPSPRSRGYSMEPEGMAVYRKLKAIRQRYKTSTVPTDVAKKDRLPNLDRALTMTPELGQGMIVMDRMGGEDFQELLLAPPGAPAGELKKEAGGHVQKGATDYDLPTICNSANFHQQLGRLVAADALLGNSDRLSQVTERGATQNIFNDKNFRLMHTGAVVTIDSDTQSLGREALQEAGGVTTPEEWTEFLIGGGEQHLRGGDPEARATQGLEILFDPARRRVLYDLIKEKLEATISDAGFTFQFVNFATFDGPFTTGIRAGLTGMITHLAQLQAQAQALSAESGGFVNPAALKVKAQYAATRMRELTQAGAGLPPADALDFFRNLAVLQEQVSPRLLGALPLISLPATKLSALEKFGRSIAHKFTGSANKATMAEADTIKNHARAGSITPQEADRGLDLPGSDRRIDKAKFLATCGKLELDLRARNNAFDYLSTAYPRFAAHLTLGPGPHNLNLIALPVRDALGVFDPFKTFLDGAADWLTPQLTEAPDAGLRGRLLGLKGQVGLKFVDLRGRSTVASPAPYP